MKNILFATLCSMAIQAQASGFLCEGSGYKAKLYNHVSPTEGTANPAVLIVSEEDGGTLARLSDDEIEKTTSSKTVTYAGVTNQERNGRFVSVALKLVKSPISEGSLEGQYFAILTVTEDGMVLNVKMACKRYLKGEIED